MARDYELDQNRIKKDMEIIKAKARKYSPCIPDWIELYEHMIVAYCRYLNKYEKREGINQYIYCMRKANWACIDFLRSNGTYRRDSQIKTELDCSLHAIPSGCFNTNKITVTEIDSIISITKLSKIERKAWELSLRRGETRDFAKESGISSGVLSYHKQKAQEKIQCVFSQYNDMLGKISA